jgi:hypothetical protein
VAGRRADPGPVCHFPAHRRPCLHSQLTREQDSPSIVFFDKLEEAVFTPLKERKLVIYRDWHIYVPEATAGRVEMNWDFLIRLHR